MALKIIVEKEEIARLHIRLSRILKARMRNQVKEFYVKTRGGNLYVNAHSNTDKENSIWWSNDRAPKENKYYNLIGINPNFKSANRILIQLNYQIDFRNLSEGAIWAKNEKNKIFLLHSGRMGGGVEGITKANIDVLYAGARSIVLYKKNEHNYFTVCELTSKRVYEQIIAFINEIDDIKKQLNEDYLKVKTNRKKAKSLKKYTPEFWGKRKTYFLKGKVSSSSDHGLIVESLKNELENKFGYKNKIVKNKYIDLGIAIKNKPIAIFEIKTNVFMQMIYTAVGQLTLHAFTTKTSPKKYFVVPDTLNSSIDKDIFSLGVRTIKFNWRNNKPNFINLQEYF